MRSVPVFVEEGIDLVLHTACGHAWPSEKAGATTAGMELYETTLRDVETHVSARPRLRDCGTWDKET